MRYAFFGVLFSSKYTLNELLMTGLLYNYEYEMKYNIFEENLSTKNNSEFILCKS